MSEAGAKPAPGTAGPSDAAVRQATGKGWVEWVEALKRAGAEQWPHKEIASRLRADHQVSGWWSQSIAVEFERAIGRRQVGQTCAGDFSASASKTLPGSIDEALATWRGHVGNRREFAEAAIIGEPRISETGNWRYWRAELDDGSKLSIVIGAKPGGKAGLAVNHDKLADKMAADRWKAYWRTLLKELR